MAYRIEHYLTPHEHDDIYIKWLSRIRDQRTKVAVIRRVARIEAGNFGDHKYCRDGVWELRIDLGAGLRVYYAHSALRVVLLLCGGRKQTQQADIDRAVFYWNEWQSRNDHEKQDS